ncbi:hypothetical protein RH915_02715, partial [Serpentinicella sp. ANB-PHB4]|nr:hypothetical protein [Serpentinicella sp. ANB-PHB4]
MKKTLLMALVLILASVMALSGCTATEEPVETGSEQEKVDGEDYVIGTYEDGRYRGIYEDRGEQQVSIQFHLEDNVISNVSFRHLYHSGNDYR